MDIGLEDGEAGDDSTKRRELVVYNTGLVGGGIDGNRGFSRGKETPGEDVTWDGKVRTGFDRELLGGSDGISVCVCTC